MARFESMTVFREVIEAGSLSAIGRKLGMLLAMVSRGPIVESTLLSAMVAAHQ